MQEHGNSFKYYMFSDMHQQMPCHIEDQSFSEMEVTSHRMDFSHKKSIYRKHPEEKRLDEYEEDNLQEQCV